MDIVVCFRKSLINEYNTDCLILYVILQRCSVVMFVCNLLIRVFLSFPVVSVGKILYALLRNGIKATLETEYIHKTAIEG